MNKTFRRPLHLILFSCCILLSVLSCKKHDAPKPFLTSDKANINATAAAGKDSIQVSANGNWSLDDPAGWVFLSAASGTGSGKVVVSYAANTAVNARSATLTLKGQNVDPVSIQVNQAGAAPLFQVDSSALQFGAVPAVNDSFNITSNAPWTISVTPASGWLSVSTTTGNGTQKIAVSAYPNKTATPKTATVTITSSVSALAPKTISITQAAADPSITSFSPADAPGGASVTLYGMAFDPSVISNNVVTVNGKAATVKQATDSTLVFTVPSLCGSGSINLQVDGKPVVVAHPRFTYDTLYKVTTFAGSGTQGYLDGPAGTAQFYGVLGIAVDGGGNLYAIDWFNQRIRKISPSGDVSTFAGNGMGGNTDGIGTAAQFSNPEGIIFNSQGNMYVTEVGMQYLRMITPAGAVTTVAGDGNRGYVDGPAASAEFDYLMDMALDPSGNLYVSDLNNQRIRKMSPSGVFSTFAGNGTAGYADGSAANAQFNKPTALAMDAQNNLYVAEASGHRIRKITPSGQVSTFAGDGIAGYRDGVGTSAEFNQPQGMAFDSNGNLIVCDLYNNRIRKISPSGVVTTIAGSTQGYKDDIGTNAQMYNPDYLTIDANGNIYVSDLNNFRIRKLTPQ